MSLSHDQFSGDFRLSEGTWERLSHVTVKGAEYDSRERQPHPKCLQGTRVDLLKYIHGLLDNQESRLVWLHGTAGVGKSAVAFTIAERMKSLKVREDTNIEKRLAGTFFFSRKHTQRCTTGYFFATLAYQLALNFPSVRKDVNKAILENPALLDPNTSLRDQMEALFLRPLRKLQSRLRSCPPLAFIVDALDECMSEAEVTDLISLLGRALREPDLPVINILLTSRSKDHIREAIQQKEVCPLVQEIPVNTAGEGVSAIISLDGADVDKDIYIFLEHSFRKLQKRHSNFPQPTRDELARLASRAGRRFIVASTMMKFVDDGYNDPRERFQVMLEFTSKLLPGTEVYKLYDRILDTCADPARAYLHLSVVAALTDPLPISQISELLGPGEGKDVETALVQLRSVMDIPADSSLPVNIYHSSVREYVSDPSNCTLLDVQHITPSHSLLARSCFRLMIQVIPASTALLDALSELKKQSRAMTHHDPRSLQQSLAFIVEPPAPLNVIMALQWLRGGQRSNLLSWLETLDGRAWLQTQGGKRWLKTPSGRDWLWTQRGEDWPHTQGIMAWLQSLWLTSTLTQIWLAAQNWVDLLLVFDLRLLVWPVILAVHSVMGTISPMILMVLWPWITVDIWRSELAIHVWITFGLLLIALEVTLVKIVLMEWARRKSYPQVQSGRRWLQARSGQRWLQTKNGQDWLQTNTGQDWLQTHSGRYWLQTKTGRDWLGTRSGQDWLQTRNGKDWLQTRDGQDWLRTQSGRNWLQTQSGLAWLQTQDGQDWLRTQSGQDWLQTQEGRDWLQIQSRQDGLQTQRGRDWLQSQNGRAWLQTERGRGWLQTEKGREWLQTPHGQAWQLTTAASVWVTMEEFSSMLDAISKYEIIPESLPLLPAFQVIQQFKSLPDFLMFPVFLVLRQQHHSTSSSPQDCLPLDMEIIHAMITFEGFAHEARERSRSASGALNYACQNWAFHLSRAPNPWDDTLNHLFKSFCNRHLLCWLERQWCLKGLRSCLAVLFEGQKLISPEEQTLVLSEGQKLAKEHRRNLSILCLVIGLLLAYCASVFYSSHAK